MVVPMSFAHGQEVSPGAVTGKSLDITGKSLDLPAKTKTGTPLRIFTRTTLLEEIQQTGRALVLVHGQVFDVTKFLPRHPGGQLAIRHLVGKDATDAMVAFHPPVVLEKRLRYYLCGEYLDVDDGDEAVHEAADDADAAAADDAGMATGMAGAPGKGTALSTSFQPLSIAYRELNDQLRADGFYTPNYWFYVRRLAVHALLIASAVTLVVRHGGDTGALLAAGLLFGMSWHGLSFIAHDAGMLAWDVAVFSSELCVIRNCDNNEFDAFPILLPRQATMRCRLIVRLMRHSGFCLLDLSVV